MATYIERLARIDAARAAQPKREYLSNAEFAKLKSALTRAKDSGDPARVLAAVEKAVERFNETTWPDAWCTWLIALEDAGWDARRQADAEFVDFENEDRLRLLAGELRAASIILFPI
jgi:hypothetical protein